MEQKAINLKTLTMDELAGVVNLYPWYGAARKELCRRMARLGSDAWGTAQFSDQAMYIGDRRTVAEIMRAGVSEDYSDKNLETLLRSYIDEKEKASVLPQAAQERKVRVVGGDFFSQSEYEAVRRDDDNVFSRVQTRKRPQGDTQEAALPDFCTETLAEIYAEQGYFEQARQIYSKLILAFPEKSAYFASLIGKLDNLINNQTL